MYQISYVTLLLLLGSFLLRSNAQHIAIIGSGSGGASSAYFIRKALGPNVNITVFEKEGRVGGRMANVSYMNTTLELGASILYTGNKHLKDVVGGLNLTAIEPPHTRGTMGIWDGTRLVFKTRVFKLFTLVHMLWRYGLSIFKLRNVVKETLDRFTRIYDLQEQCMSFETPEELWSELDLFNLTQITMRDYMAEKGVGDTTSLVVKEIVGSINRVNYNQNNGLNALAGVASLCPTVTGSVFSVQEGNAAMADAMLEAAQAVIRRNTTVRSISILQEEMAIDVPPYQLTGQAGDVVSFLGDYDAVIVASPFAFSDLEITDCKDGGSIKEDLPPRDFVTTISTFIEGHLRPGFFKTHRPPSAVFAEENATVPISSIASYIKIDQTHTVYKLFSSAPLEVEFLDSIFTSWSILFTHTWAAYPRFHPPEQMTPFVLKKGERLYYVNALETAVSAMEISAIAAKNIANLLATSYGVCARPASFVEDSDRLTKEL